MSPVKLFVLVCFMLYGSASPASQLTQDTDIEDGTTFIDGPIYVVNNDIIATVDYPNLESVNGPIYIVNNSNLTEVHFPNLKFVNGPIYVTYNSSLCVAGFPAWNLLMVLFIIIGIENRALAELMKPDIPCISARTWNAI